MTRERESILELLSSHSLLLDRHRARLRELMGIAAGAGLTPAAIAFIVADEAGQFGATCLAEGAGREFLVVSEGAAAMVVALDVPGVLQIIMRVLPEAVAPLLARPAGSVPVLIVDDDDEPALAFLGVEPLGARRCS